MTVPPMVGRITDENELPGGAVLLMKRARDAGGWFTWATGGTITKPVKVATRAETGGAAEYEERQVPRVLVKGRHREGSRFVVAYYDGKIGSAYVRNHHGIFRPATVAEVRDYIGGKDD